MIRRVITIVLVAGVLIAAAPPVTAGRVKARTYRISESATGLQADGQSRLDWPRGAISDDVRYVAFESDATNLLTTPDTNASTDVFVKDRLTGSVERISVSSTGAEANADSYDGSMSGDGRFVAFTSMATNLTMVERPLADTLDDRPISSVYVRDRQAGTTTLISKSTDLLGQAHRVEGQMPSISDDGCTVAYIGHSRVETDYGGVDVYNCATGTTTRVENHDWGPGPDVSGDGQYVAFSRHADPTPSYEGAPRVSVYSIATGTTEDVDVSSSGERANLRSFGPTISDDGRFVAFSSRATNLGGLEPGTSPYIVSRAYVRDRVSATTTLASVTSDEVPLSISVPPMISGDGASVLFDGPTSGMDVRRLAHGDTLAVAGGSGIGSVSHDGRAVAFHSLHNSLVPGDTNDTRDVFLWELLR